MLLLTPNDVFSVMVVAVVVVVGIVVILVDGDRLNFADRLTSDLGWVFSSGRRASGACL